ncbi:MAG TPA: isoprenylcysteine carboxylmethyltransferase family protein [Gemmatimonadaceae bacterium]|jgi:protein-S-isoprenylcysteine O-methyltransferase Ste14
MLRVIARLLFDTLLVATLMFVGAGSVDWPQAWVLLASMSVVRATGAFAVHRVNPTLMRERSRLRLHDAQPLSDRVLLLGVLATGFLGLPLIAALDVFRWHLLPAPPTVVAVTGLALFLAGWMLKSLALRANAFAVTVVRLQTERAHLVIDSGPYGVVRHPFYAADPFVLVGLSLWLGSYVAMLCALVPLGLMVARLTLEERFLRAALPGYTEYAAHVRFRLMPGVW